MYGNFHVKGLGKRARVSMYSFTIKEFIFSIFGHLKCCQNVFSSIVNYKTPYIDILSMALPKQGHSEGSVYFYGLSDKFDNFRSLN